MSSSDSTVNRGSGFRWTPSKAGGMRQTPPRPRRLFRRFARLYSTSP